MIIYFAIIYFAIIYFAIIYFVYINLFPGTKFKLPNKHSFSSLNS